MTDADRLRVAGRPAACETRASHSPHHIVCRACGAATGVDRVAGRAPCLATRAGAGFAIDEAQVTFWGLCPRCRATAGGPAAPADGRRS
jgi:Fur family transcriptional regulator, stress-responsive regulator